MITYKSKTNYLTMWQPYAIVRFHFLRCRWLWVRHTGCQSRKNEHCNCKNTFFFSFVPEEDYIIFNSTKTTFILLCFVVSFFWHIFRTENCTYAPSTKMRAVITTNSYSGSLFFSSRDFLLVIWPFLWLLHVYSVKCSQKLRVVGHHLL